MASYGVHTERLLTGSQTVPQVEKEYDAIRFIFTCVRQLCASVCVVRTTGWHTDTQHTAGTEKGRQQLRDRAAFLQSTMVKAPDAAQENSESGCTLQ